MRIRSCPFCGGPAEHGPTADGYATACRVCKAKIFHRTAYEAEHRWHRRVGDDTPRPPEPSTRDLIQAALRSRGSEDRVWVKLREALMWLFAEEGY